MSDRLREARINAGYDSATEAAKRCGVSVATYVSHENGTRGFKADSAQLYGRAFGVKPEWLLFGKGSGEKVETNFFTEGLRIRYHVQAGVWQEVEEMTQEEWGLAPFLPDPKIPINEQWAEQIIGDSVNKCFPDGAIIHVRKFHGEIEQWPIGKLVVVMHSDNGRFKRTVKRLILQNNKPTLIGESTIERWNKPVAFGDTANDGEYAEIDAIVIRGMIMA